MLEKGLASIAIAAFLGAPACAVHPAPDPVPPPYFGANGYAWPPEVFSGAPEWTTGSAAKVAPESAHAGGGAPAGTEPKTPAMEPILVSKDGCVESLSSAGVDFDQVDSVRGVDTPVVVTSDIGQVRYHANGGVPLLLDCRMALTLAKLSPVLREHGVSEVRFSGAYVYRMSSKGRLSLHARGLALDIHEMTIRGEKVPIKGGFKKGLGSECTANFPVLNRIACSLESTGVFKELLTPDYDADHHDHFHIAIAPLDPETHGQ